MIAISTAPPTAPPMRRGLITPSEPSASEFLPLLVGHDSVPLAGLVKAWMFFSAEKLAGAIWNSSVS